MTWNTKPNPTQARASIGNSAVNHYFLFNPDEVKWSVANNTVSRDTIGGRVVQILSSKVDQMTVVGRAGSRDELQRFALNLKSIMNWQIKNQSPVYFKVPSKKWNFKVYVQNVSSLGWDYAATSYPYELTLLVQEDLTGLTSKVIQKNTLSRLAEGIGYVEDFHGGNAEEALATSEAYLNTIGYLRSEGSTVTPDTLGGGGDGSAPASDPTGGTGSSGGNASYQGSTAFPAGISTLKWEGANLREKVTNMLTQYAARNAVFEPVDVQRGLCTIQYESGWNPSATNKNTNGSIDRGLWQINSIHNKATWWPNDVNVLFNAEYNTRAALCIWTAAGSYNPWYGYKNHCT